MKKPVTLLLAFFFLLSSAGISFSFHYCKGRITGIAVYTEKNCGCNTHKQNDCCHNEYSFFKIKDDYTSSGTCAPAVTKAHAGKKKHTICVAGSGGFPNPCCFPSCYCCSPGHLFSCQVPISAHPFRL